MLILNINARYAGSNHDSYIWGNSLAYSHMEQQYLQNPNNWNTWLLGMLLFYNIVWHLLKLVSYFQEILAILFNHGCSHHFVHKPMHNNVNLTCYIKKLDVFVNDASDC